MNFVFKMMNFVFKMMNFVDVPGSGGGDERSIANDHLN